MSTPNPKTALDWYKRGYELKGASDFTGSLNAFRQSIKLNQNVAAPWIGLAQLLDNNEQAEDARGCLIQAVKSEPSNLLARQLLGSSHQRLGFIELAEKEFNEALAIEPNSDLTHYALGQLYEDKGQPLHAANCYRRSMALAPKKIESLASILELGNDTDINDEVDKARQIIDALPINEKAIVGYGLGKALERQNKFDDAFRAFSTANHARSIESNPFDRQQFDERIDRLIKLFNSKFYEQRKGWGSNSSQPVFIVGLPRSGTTLTEQILSSHPQCFGAGELNVLTDLATSIPDRIKDSQTSWPSSVLYLDEQHLDTMSNEYLTISRQRAKTASIRIIDKQPLNFWHVGLIALAFPNARILHCTRDIRDCGLSIFTQNFNISQNWATNLDDIAHYWKGYKKLMHHFGNICPENILEVRYEDTVENIQEQSERLLNFIGLDWDNKVLEFYKSKRAVQTPSRWQVRKPVYTTSTARWENYKKYLSALIQAKKHTM